MLEDKYAALSDDEDDTARLIPGEQHAYLTRKRRRTWQFYLTFSLILFLFSSIAITGIRLGYIKISSRSLVGHSTCRHARIRREWRSLNVGEKRNYIKAVQCVQNLPSELTGNGNLYDDFVYTHMSTGLQTHSAASFLPWHRAFLHIYETVLTERCGLTIPVPYWNWEFDHQSLAQSSIWDPDTGFGGDGAANLAQHEVGNGRCVVDGPFANVTRLYWDEREQPHCLSRSFTNIENGKLGETSAYYFAPKRIGAIKRLETYALFEDGLEREMHNALHQSIKGDFVNAASVNDPIFWLHHGQLDHLWWKWQQENPRVRDLEYQGVSLNTPGEKRQASLDDMLKYTGLWRDVQVLEIMRTEGDLLCYRY